MPDHEFCLFVEAVRARLMKGAVAYENRSFSKDPLALVEELRQEALDLAGWGFILFCRLEAMATALEASRAAQGDGRAGGSYRL
jgi:hypothetical protein